jgi:hypothetical protein
VTLPSLADAEIVQLVAQLARLRRMQFGRSSEKLDREIEQLELVLDDLKEEESTRLEARPMGGEISPANPSSGSCPIICRARRSSIGPPAPVPNAGASCASSARM